jgi:hypothetical protein
MPRLRRARENGRRCLSDIRKEAEHGWLQPRAVSAALRARNEPNGCEGRGTKGSWKAPDTAFSGGAISGIMCLRRARDDGILEGGPVREKMLTPTCGFTTCTSQHEVHLRFTQMPHEAAITSNGLYGSFS